MKPPRPTSPREERSQNATELVVAELERAVAKFGPMASAHEGWAVIQEEVDELWAEVKTVQSRRRMRDEAVQIAAMAMRFLIDVCEVPRA